jgi:hypothetical protein
VGVIITGMPSSKLVATIGAVVRLQELGERHALGGTGGQGSEN